MAGHSGKSNKTIPKLTRHAKRYASHQVTNLGAHVTSLIICAFIDSIFYIKRMLLHLWNMAIVPRTKFCGFCSDLIHWITSPYRKLSAFFKGTGKEIKSAYGQKGIGAAILIGVAAVVNGLWDHRRYAVTAFNYILPIVSIAFFMNLVGFATDLEYAVSVSFGGQVVGYIENETVYDDAKNIMQQRITYVDGNDIVELTPVFEVERINGQAVIGAMELADQMLAQVSDDLQTAYGLYIDDKFYGAVKDKTPIEDALERVLDKYATGVEGEVATFKETVTYNQGLYLAESIVPEQDIVSVLTSVRSVAKYYTVEDGDTPIGIAQKNNISLEELLNKNPEAENTLYPGQQILLDGEQPYLTVQIARVENYDVEVPYETVQVEDSSMYVETKTINRYGENGIVNTTAKVTYVNGVETKREVISAQVVSDPVDEVIAIGTKPIPLSTAVSTQQGAAGMYIWPVGGGNTRISGYINEWRATGWHTGIDIPAPYGTSIYAGAAGTVVYSGWMTSYGKVVYIDHGNGWQTRYAHCSALLVSVGQQVPLGQEIAKIGATGYATGNHLHFEVRYNGQYLDPLDYVLRY